MLASSKFSFVNFYFLPVVLIVFVLLSLRVLIVLVSLNYSFLGSLVWYSLLSIELSEFSYLVYFGVLENDQSQDFYLLSSKRCRVVYLLTVAALEVSYRRDIASCEVRLVFRLVTLINFNKGLNLIII